MKSIIALLGLAGLASAQYAAHSGKDHMDQTNSTKTEGLVLWQHFFQEYVEAGVIISSDQVSGYDANIHACYFHFNIEQWIDTDVDTRYAITALQNCHPSLITSFTFTLTLERQIGAVVRDDDTPTGSVTDSADATTVSGVVLTNNTSASDLFGVLLPNSYDNDSAAAAALASYTYTTEFPSSD